MLRCCCAHSTEPHADRRIRRESNKTCPNNGVYPSPGSNPSSCHEIVPFTERNDYLFIKAEKCIFCSVVVCPFASPPLLLLLLRFLIRVDSLASPCREAPDLVKDNSNGPDFTCCCSRRSVKQAEQQAVWSLLSFALNFPYDGKHQRTKQALRCCKRRHSLPQSVAERRRYKCVSSTV